jgi:hypothetical protein
MLRLIAAAAAKYSLSESAQDAIEAHQVCPR